MMGVGENYSDLKAKEKQKHKMARQRSGVPVRCEQETSQNIQSVDSYGVNLWLSAHSGWVLMWSLEDCSLLGAWYSKHPMMSLSYQGFRAGGHQGVGGSSKEWGPGHAA